jgi:hypothetical protein
VLSPAKGLSLMGTCATAKGSLGLVIRIDEGS